MQKISHPQEWISEAVKPRSLSALGQVVTERMPNLLLLRSTSGTPTTVAYHPEQIKDQLKTGTIATKRMPWHYDEVLQTKLLITPTATDDTQKLKGILRYDFVTEADAIRLFNHLAENPPNDMPNELWPVLLLWLQDEINHHCGFLAAYNQLFGEDPQLLDQLANQKSNFSAYRELTENCFNLLVALSYDEAATICGYKNDLPLYRIAGPNLVNFVRKVSADEGWHFFKFSRLLVKTWPERLDTVPAILDSVLKHDGRPYARTFFMDHDPAVEAQFNAEMREKAASIVIATIRKLSKKST